MTVGIEVAGLALAVFPVVIEIVDWYGGKVKSRETKFLVESLETYEQIFLDSVENLLRCIVPAADLRVLLTDLEGDAWKDQALADRVEEHLGSDDNKLLERINDIYKTVLKLKEKLPTLNKNTKDQNLVDRVKHVAKCFIKNPHYRASLACLKTRINEFRILTEGGVKLAPSRAGVPRALRNLDVVSDCASGLHEALSGGWKCNCEHLHPAKLKLDVWSQHAEEVPEEDNDNVRLNFSFLFADDAQEAESCHWMTAEIISSKASPKGARPIVFGSPGSSPTPISLRRTTSPQTMSPVGSDLTPVVSQDSQQNHFDQVEEIEDLCSILKQKEERPRMRRRVGSLSDSTGQRYHLFSKSDEPAAPLRSTSSVKLAEYFRRRERLSNKNRVQLALMLAWGVLQISSTSWLSGKWTKDNILLVMDTPDKPRPYVSHRFISSRRDSQSSTLDPTTSDQIAAWVRNASLFALGVFLLEVCYNRSIEDLAIREEKNDNGEPTAHTPFLTAMRLSNQVHDELGSNYGNAVEACLRLPNVDIGMDGKPKDPAQFAKRIFEYIISPLEKVSEFLSK